jgi:hypothetical protein
MGRAADIEAFAAALDPTLALFGFRRRKKAQEWVRNYDDLNRELVHINFRLAIVNPSIAVEYRDIAAAAPRELGCAHSMAMLKSLVTRGSSYDFETDISVLSKDITEFGLPYLDKLHDRD